MRSFFTFVASFVAFSSAIYAQSATDVLNSLRVHLDSSDVELLKTSFVQVFTEIENPTRVMSLFETQVLPDIQFMVEDDSGNRWVTNSDFTSTPQKFETYEKDYFESTSRKLRFQFIHQGQAMTVKDQFHQCVWMNEQGFELAFEPWKLSPQPEKKSIFSGYDVEEFFKNSGKFSLVWKRKEINSPVLDNGQESWWDAIWD